MRAAVLAILQPQPLPMDGRVKVTVVLNVDHDLGADGDGGATSPRRSLAKVAAIGRALETDRR
jgi:hypothetical protein